MSVSLHQDQEIVSSALRLQPTIVTDLITDLLAQLQHRIKLSFDMNSLSREMNKGAFHHTQHLHSIIDMRSFQIRLQP